MPKPKPQYLENGDPELMDPNELEMASGQNTQDPRLAFDPHVYQDPDGSISNPLDDWMVAQDLAKRGAGLNYGPKTPTPSPASVAAQPKGYEPPPQMTKYSQALTGRLDDQGQPVPYDPKDITTGPPQMKEPKWWQRALAIGAGGAAGFANAMGKRAPAIDVGSMGENILHPGYGEQMSEWKQRVAPLQAAAQIAQNQQQFAGQQQLNQSMIERNKAQGQYYSGQGRGSMLVTQAISDASGGKLPVGTTQPYQVVDQVLGQNKGMMLVDDDTAAMTGLKSGSNYPTSVVTARLKARSAPNAITVALNKARIDPNNLPDENDPRWANVQVGAGKPMSADDKARAIFSKPEAQWTPEDQAFITGYKKVNDLTKVQPGVARMEVLGQTRECLIRKTGILRRSSMQPI
jgi:microcystin-dependent protein